MRRKRNPTPRRVAATHLADPEAVRLLIEVAERRGFQGAADVRGCSRENIARRIARLEAWAGAPLVDRAPRKMALTEAGRRLVERARPMLEQWATLASPEATAPVRGPVRLAAPARAHGWLAPRLAAFAHAYPEAELVVGADLPTPDLVLTCGATKGPVDAGRPLGALPHRLVASPRYAAARGLPAHPDGLADHVALVHPDDLPGWVLERVATRESTVALPRVRAWAGSLELVLAGALGGLGLARLPEPACAEALAAGRLVPALPEWTPRAEPLALRPTSPRPLARVLALSGALAATGLDA